MSSKSNLEKANFTSVDESLQLWHEEREKKGNVYQAIGEYIIFLEGTLESEVDFCERYITEAKIKKLRKEQKKYYVPSILETAKFELAKTNDDGKESLEKSSIALVKRLNKGKK